MHYMQFQPKDMKVNLVLKLLAAHINTFVAVSRK